MTVAISDEFTDTDLTDIRSHAPDVDTPGSGYTRVSGVTGPGLHIASNMLAYGGSTDGDGNDEAVLIGALGSADLQIWCKYEKVSGAGGLMLAGRGLDRDNGVGIIMGGTGASGLRLVSRASGTDSILFSTQGTTGRWARAKFVGDTVSFWVSAGTSEPASPEDDTNWTLVGSTTETNQNTRQTPGLLKIAAANSASALVFDSWRAAVIGAAGASSVPYLNHARRASAALLAR